MNQVQAPIAPPFQSTTSRSTISIYFFNIAQSWPASASPSLLDHSHQDQLHTCSISASKYICESLNLGFQQIFKLAGSWPAMWEDFGHQVHLPTCWITASMLAWSWPLLHLYTCSILASKWISEFTSSQPLSTSLALLDHSLQFHTLPASKCVSKVAQLQLPSAPLSSLNPGLQVYVQPHRIITS